MGVGMAHQPRGAEVLEDLKAPSTRAQGLSLETFQPSRGRTPALRPNCLPNGQSRWLQCLGPRDPGKGWAARIPGSPRTLDWLSCFSTPWSSHHRPKPGLRANLAPKKQEENLRLELGWGVERRKKPEGWCSPSSHGLSPSPLTGGSPRLVPHPCSSSCLIPGGCTWTDPVPHAAA